MMKNALSDELRPFATPRQWEVLNAVAEHGSERAAAEALGIHRRAIFSARKAVEAKALKHGYAPEHDYTRPTPDGYLLRGVSTLYNGKGEIAAQWVKSARDPDRQDELFRVALEAMAESLPAVPLIAKPLDTLDDYCACYPVGDHHLGMLSWEKETGANYDLKIGESILRSAADYLVNASPAASTALVAFLGDFMHYDSFEAVTPTGHNLLDADGRYPMMVRVAVRSMRYLIERAAAKHAKVHVIVEIGNHDLSSSIFLMECLASIYANNPRITIDTSPSHYHYFRFGSTLVGTHHGHGTKMANLPLIMAADRKADWGETDYRYWWTGHVHHAKTQPAVSAQDFTGCTVESFRVLCPPDAWAAQKGYRAARDMKGIVLHKRFGEISRVTVNPQMFEPIN